MVAGGILLSHIYIKHILSPHVYAALHMISFDKAISHILSFSLYIISLLTTQSYVPLPLYISLSLSFHVPSPTKRVLFIPPVPLPILSKVGLFLNSIRAINVQISKPSFTLDHGN